MISPGGARGFTLYDEAGDVTIGREADPEILKRFGYYEAPDLQNYVAQVGRRVVAASDTRFNFQFKVVDHTSINAMALPGGFVYITRGILAEMNDEAQLAGILGHEATHVNSRHGAKLMTKAMATQIATVLGVGAAAAAGSGSAAGAVTMGREADPEILKRFGYYDAPDLPGGGADIINAGPGNNEIHDITAHLNGITVTDFNSYVTVSTAEGAPARERGRMVAPPGPGLGIEPRLDVLGDPILVVR